EVQGVLPNATKARRWQPPGCPRVMQVFELERKGRARKEESTPDTQHLFFAFFVGPVGVGRRSFCVVTRCRRSQEAKRGRTARDQHRCKREERRAGICHAYS